MKKRYVIKKGKLEITRNGRFVLKLASKITRILKPLSRKIQVVGSIRRGEKKPVDIDVVLIPKNREKLRMKMEELGKFVQGGEHESTWKIQGVKIELYYAENSGEWGSMILAYSSRFGAGIGLRIVAMKKGFKLNQHGLFERRTGKKVAGKTEEEIYHALGRPWKKPEER